jgi:hypothetical protein
MTTDTTPTPRKRTARKPARRPSVQHQIDALASRMDAADRTREDTHTMVAAMHQALMIPQYGHGDKSLLERMADVTVAIESGDQATESLVKWLKRLAYVGATLAALGAAALKLEFWKGTP